MGRSDDKDLQKKSVELLEKISKGDPDKVVAIWATVSLMALDKPNEEGVGRLKTYVKNPDQRVRLNAIQGLGIIGNRGPGVVTALRALLQDKDPLIIGAACSALAGLGDDAKPAIDELVEMARGKVVDKAARLAAINALGIISTRVKSVIPTIAELLQDTEPRVIASAVLILAGLGKEGAQALPALTVLSDRKDIDKSLVTLTENAIKHIKEEVKKDMKK
jgi:HEAT repeat protein